MGNLTKRYSVLFQHYRVCFTLLLSHAEVHLLCFVLVVHLSVIHTWSPNNQTHWHLCLCECVFYAYDLCVFFWWHKQGLSQSFCPWGQFFYSLSRSISLIAVVLLSVSACHALRLPWWPGECVISGVVMRSAPDAHFLFPIRCEAVTRCSKHFPSGFRAHRSPGVQRAREEEKKMARRANRSLVVSLNLLVACTEINRLMCFGSCELKDNSLKCWIFLAACYCMFKAMYNEV